MNKLNLNQIEFKEVMNKEYFLSIIESLLFTTGEPMKLKDIASIIGFSESNTKRLIKELSLEYEKDIRGIELIITDDKYALASKRINNSYVEKILNINSRQSLSQASLEILAIIAYRQPITRILIEEIRGVKSDSAINTLVQKKLIEEKGRLDAPGRPILYATTDEFLSYFGIENLIDLPLIDGLVDEEVDEEEKDNE
ncbi:MAG: SMC-Scp complex subunit ScpB [Clostridiaceae bacterium]